MTTYTKSELATRVLRYEGLIGAEETPSAADSDHVQEIIASEMDAMQSRGIALWNVTDESISTEYLMPLVKRLGPIVGAAFGKYSTMEATDAANKIERLELRVLSAKPSTGAVMAPEYF